jgi:hypothetical protein
MVVINFVIERVCQKLQPRIGLSAGLAFIERQTNQQQMPLYEKMYNTLFLRPNIAQVVLAVVLLLSTILFFQVRCKCLVNRPFLHPPNCRIARVISFLLNGFPNGTFLSEINLWYNCKIFRH